ncbi:uncharacterized protein LOC127538547 [Antechinus flavipes]|uniref:uncharacterized protein LOC127538547 n=1 Tax=Antechinus flavipes TaxID=38775 RepID=UPI0022365B2D|nr:uncharacterized protein LOC127538547 [Antechinus flavipes]
METDDKIAIVGIGCNFPGGEGIDNFWQVLVKGQNCTVEISPERFNTEEWYDANDNTPGKSRSKEAALIEGFNDFDNKLFGINDAEAERMDPQQKILLECSYRALEDAGIPIEDVAGSKIGVFIGLMNQEFANVIRNLYNILNHYDVTGSSPTIAANRISYVFHLTGPSLCIDTACSSSLAALHFACLSIKQGDCEAALCGGVSIILDPLLYVSLSKAKMISPEGMSKPFSKEANGYGRGEGCGIVLLKPLRKALEDCNKIWGVINISAVNQDGRSVTPITKPSQKQQEKLLESIYSTHINPSIVQYIEAHGTGTPTGDPIEAESIGNIVGRRRARNLPPLKVGSVKGNIGHTESTAGVAGLIKVLLMMKHEKFVPSLHYSEDVSSINTEKLNISIPTAIEKWEESAEFGRIAGINSFGFGGTNAHVVVKQFKQQLQDIPSKRPYEIFILSAASSKSLTLTIEDTAQQLHENDHVSLQNLAYTSACRRSHVNYKYRKAFVTTSLGNLQQQLILATGVQTSQRKGIPQLVFVFCGNGAHYKGMGKVLLRSEPVFREKCQEISKLFLQYAPINLLDLIEEEFDDFSKPTIIQPLLFLIQVALASLLKFWGIEPAAIVGHSVGEVAAAHCAGYLTLEDAVKIIYYRSKFQAKVTGGKMLVVGNIPVEEISKSLAPHSGKICIAAFNSPNSCTISGEADTINAFREELSQQFGARNVFLFELEVPAAYHSHMMDPIIMDITENIKDLSRQEPEVEIFSTVTGKRASEEDFTTSKYWSRNIREPVAFTQAIKASVQGKDNVMFIEIAPKQVLHRNIKETLGKESVVLPALQAEKDYETLFALVENLFESGYNLNWLHFYDGLKVVPTEYPRYKFDHQKLNTYLKSNQQQHSPDHSGHPLINSVNSNLEITCTISQNTTPYVYEHKNNGIPLVPGALFAEVGLASIMISSRPKIPLSTCQLSISFLLPCVANEDTLDLQVKLELKKTATEFKIFSPSAVFARGQVTKIPEGNLSECKHLSLKSIFQRCKSIIVIREFYEILSFVGFQYGAIFKQLDDIFYCDKLKEGIATLKVNEATRKEMHDYHIHPVLLDCFLQMTAIIASRSTKAGRKAAFPSTIGSLVVFKPLEEEMKIYMKANKSTENYLEVCGFFTDKHGQVLAELKHVGITYVTSANDDFLFENKWIPISSVPMAGYSLESPQFLVFADKFGIAKQLKKYLHSQSKYITFEEWETIQKSEKSERDLMRKEIKGFHNVLFMWGIQKFNEDSPGLLIMQQSAKCCETLRQIILALREQNAHCSVTLITYRTTSRNVDHINPGFALSGMMRCCFVEVPDITLKMIDISFTSTQDIESLAEAIIKYKGEDYPELWIDQGKMYFTEVKHTPFELPPERPTTSGMLTLYTANPYKAIDLSAQVTEPKVIHLENHAIEVQMERMCIHSEDYFPVSTTSSTFGKTLYWTEHTVEQHQLLALDFSGIVTNIGKGVKEVKIGDHIATCFPVTASSRVLIPEMTCFKTNKLPILKDTPCVSYFIIAWRILTQILPKPKTLAPLSVISTHLGSILGQVLTLAAKDMGWKASLLSPSPDLHKTVKQCQALIFLPSLTNFSTEMLSDLSNLRDVVVLHGSHQPEFLQQLFHYSHDHIQVHTLNINPVFQKSALIQNSRAVFKWAKSMTFPKKTKLTYSIFQPTGSVVDTEPALFSYFTCPAILLAVLRGKLPETEVSEIPKTATRKKLFQSKAVYIVSGGLSGLGFETVRFIVQNGGGYVVILSRRSPNAELQEEIRSLEDQNKGCKIISLQCDVSVHTNVYQVISSIGDNFPKVPIKGVFHSAVVLDDAHLEALDLTRFEKVLSPKVAGVINLHCATKGHELDYFVCHSSVTSFLGNSTQTNYAAANTFLDIFCHYRRNCGLAGQSINWGALNLGLLLNKQNLQQFLASKGILTLQKSEVYEYLEKSLLLNNPQQAIVKFDFKRMSNYFFSQVPSFKIRFASLARNEYKLAGETNSTVHQDSSQMTTKDYIYSLISELTNTNVEDITMNTSLMSLGMDSMSAMTLQNKLFSDKKVDVPLVRLLDPNTTLMTIHSLLEKPSENIEDNGHSDRNQDTYF